LTINPDDTVTYTGPGANGGTITGTYNPATAQFTFSSPPAGFAALATDTSGRVLLPDNTTPGGTPPEP
jgi:hypothetical protein